jgi:hypothetical protein
MPWLLRLFLVLSVIASAPAVAPCCVPAPEVDCCDDESGCPPGPDGECVVTADAPFLVQSAEGREVPPLAVLAAPTAATAGDAFTRFEPPIPAGFAPPPPRRNRPLRL